MLGQMLKLLEFQSFCIFVALTFAYYNNKAPYNKSLWQEPIWWLLNLW